jgi:hypothetical protein
VSEYSILRTCHTHALEQSARQPLGGVPTLRVEFIQYPFTFVSDSVNSDGVIPDEITRRPRTFFQNSAGHLNSGVLKVLDSS